MTKVATVASNIVEQFSDHAELSQSEIEGKLDHLVSEYKVPLDEAERTVRNNVMDKHDIDNSEYGQNAPGAPQQDQQNPDEFDPTPVEEITEAEEWHDLRVDVIDLWDPSHEDMAQVGLLGDHSDVIKFVIWENDSGTPVELLEEGETYEISNVVSDEYKGRYSVVFRQSSTVEHVEGESASTGNNDVTIEGVLVDVRPGSGLIKRCPEEDCTRVLKNGRCPEHGEVEGEFDLRIKAVIDDGVTAQNVVFNQEATEEVAGIELEEAKEMAMDALDTSVVAQEIKAEVLGEHFEIQGPKLGQNVLVNEATTTDGITNEIVEELQSKAETVSTAVDSQNAEASA